MSVCIFWCFMLITFSANNGATIETLTVFRLHEELCHFIDIECLLFAVTKFINVLLHIKCPSCFCQIEEPDAKWHAVVVFIKKFEIRYFFWTLSKMNSLRRMAAHKPTVKTIPYRMQNRMKWIDWNSYWLIDLLNNFKLKVAMLELRWLST